MQKIHLLLRNTILAVVDFFYPLFKKVMPIQTYRYAACGGFNTVFGIAMYFVGFHYLFTNDVVHVTDNFVLKRHIAADYLFAFWVSFPVGFYLSRYVVFQASPLPKKVQLFRYFLVVVGAIGLNYILLKLFVEVFSVPGPLAKIITSCFIIAYSYFSQIYFSFKTK